MVVMILKMLIVIIFMMLLFLMMTKHSLGWCSNKIWLSNQAVDVLLGRAVRSASDSLYSLSDISKVVVENIKGVCWNTLKVYLWVVHILLLSLFIVFSLSVLQYCINSLKVTWSWKPITNHFVLAMALVRAIACLFPSCYRNFKVASFVFPGMISFPFAEVKLLRSTFTLGYPCLFNGTMLLNLRDTRMSSGILPRTSWVWHTTGDLTCWTWLKWGVHGRTIVTNHWN
jgi:hypothetical protein